jgi:23S rRNA maturation-related 3'-5' exoribonuclease YhaM
MITGQKARKNILNSFSHLSIDDLKMAITEYIRNMDRAILNTVFEHIVRRVNKCLETGGGQFEHYL